ncbi:hypothetical protein HPB47_024783 [Ixodes persulcatus]|uniref:Uncharacterized protein n=1 Tax=Ixodes persulcatus TaxID=34615 RepID=A0AC60Q3G2_IXOPE|nr:hypothetical protein HPB47_024783 [Ixodes persulcatus]
MDNPATRTNNVAGENSIRIANTGCARRGFTVVLAARASEAKLPAFVVLKEPTGRIPARVDPTDEYALGALSRRVVFDVLDWIRLYFCPVSVFAANIRLTSSKNGWMTTDICLEWLSHVWGPNIDDVRRLLVIDQAPIHKTKAVMDTAEASATDIVHIPGSYTGILQPADVCWNKLFKDSLHTSWAEFMRKGDTTPKGSLRKPSKQDVLNFVSKAWAAVPEDMIARSFKGCGISGALDGSEDGYLHNGLAGIEAPAACSNPEGVSDECPARFAAPEQSGSTMSPPERRVR